MPRLKKKSLEMEFREERNRRRYGETSRSRVKAGLAEKELISYREKQAEAKRNYRAKLSDEEQKRRRAIAAEKKRQQRAKLTPEELIIHRAEQMESRRNRRSKLSDEEKIFRRVQQSEMTRLRRESMKNFNTQNPQQKDIQPAGNPVTVDLTDEAVGESILEVTQTTPAPPLPAEPNSKNTMTLANDRAQGSQEEETQVIMEIQRLKARVQAMKKAGVQIIKNKVESAVRSLIRTTAGQNAGKRMNVVLPNKLIISQTEGQQKRKARAPLKNTIQTRLDFPMSPESLPGSPPAPPFSPASVGADSPNSEPENDSVGKESDQEEDQEAKKLKNKNGRALRAERRQKKKVEPPSENEDSGSNNEYVCSLCEREFTSRAGLNVHMKKHKKRMKEKRKGPKKTSLRISTAILEDGLCTISGNVYSCSICPNKYSSPMGLSGHMHKHYKKDGLPEREIKEDPKKPVNKRFVFETAEAGTSFSENGTSAMYVCPVCQINFDTKIGCSMHLRRQHTEAEVTEAKEKLPADASTVPRANFTMYTCELCQEKFFHVSKYREHLIQSHKENKELIQKYCFCCPNCQDAHISKMSLTQHLRDMHGIYIQCPICDENIQTQDLFTKHVNVSHAEYSKNENFLEYSGLYVCKCCGFAKESYSIALDHYANWHSAEKSYICDTCGKTFGTERTRNRHVYHSHSQKSYFCEKCAKTYNTPQTFKQHLRTHESGPRIACHDPTCTKTFKSKDNARKHFLKIHEGAERFLCSVCKKVFTIGKYREHLIQSHKENKELIQKYCFCCPCCQDAHISKTFLTRHLREIHGIYIQCPICDECIQTQDLFTKHVNVSHSEYSKNENFLEYSGLYVCKWCGFTQEKYNIILDHYENVHAIDKPYICDTCGKSFATEHSKNRHIIQAHSQKSYFCEMCAKTFNASSNFKQHLRTHETGPRIPCRDPTCTKTFKSKDNARKHFLDIHQATKKFLCSICGKSFNSQSSLMIHKVKVCEKDSAKKMPCPVCGKVLDNFLLLSYHKNNFHKYGNTEETYCHRCNKSMASAYALYAHNNQNHKNGDAEVTDPNSRPKKKSSRSSRNSDLDYYADY